MVAARFDGGLYCGLTCLLWIKHDGGRSGDRVYRHVADTRDPSQLFLDPASAEDREQAAHFKCTGRHGGCLHVCGADCDQACLPCF